MMQTKLFEIRDRATCIMALAVKFNADNDHERWMLSHAGYGYLDQDHSEYVLLGSLDGDFKGTTDPYKQDSGTMLIAHQYIRQFWSYLQSGQVIDCQFIRGETDKPVESDRAEFMRRFR